VTSYFCDLFVQGMRNVVDLACRLVLAISLKDWPKPETEGNARPVENVALTTKDLQEREHNL
jgi:hypothetical protein